jgi:predicted DNA-binding transcriptional regulator AlpA
MPWDGDLAILTERDAAAMVCLSVRTLQRLRVDGGGPEFIKLTARRIGYSQSALAAWLRARSATSASDATNRFSVDRTS